MFYLLLTILSICSPIALIIWAMAGFPSAYITHIVGLFLFLSLAIKIERLETTVKSLSKKLDTKNEREE